MKKIEKIKLSNEGEHGPSWGAEFLKSISSIKIGCDRRAVEALFVKDSGLSRNCITRYRHRVYGWIKLDVGYEVRVGDGERSEVVDSLSAPYISNQYLD